MRSRREKTTTRQRNQQEEEKLGGRRKSSGVCSFNLSTLVQIPDGLHGQWTEIHPKVGKKYVILSSEALICLFLNDDELFCVLMVMEFVCDLNNIDYPAHQAGRKWTHYCCCLWVHQAGSEQAAAETNFKS